MGYLMLAGVSYTKRRRSSSQARSRSRPMQLRGRVALVTGTASGLGRGGARERLCAARAKVVGSDVEGREPRELSAVRSTTGPTQMSVSTFGRDVGQDAVARVGDRIGRVDTAINCAGGGWFVTSSKTFTLT